MIHPGRRARWEDPAVRAAIDAAIDEELAWVIQGKAAGPQVEHEAREAVRQVLERFGLRGQIHVRSVRGAVSVEIALPASQPVVREVRVRMG
jgi:hypothetical protein